MTADVEDEYVVAQANEPLDEGKHFIRPRVSARRRDEILEIDAAESRLHGRFSANDGLCCYRLHPLPGER